MQGLGIENSSLQRGPKGALAQSVEQWTENPRVPSSILGGATITPPARDTQSGGLPNWKHSSRSCTCLLRFL